MFLLNSAEGTLVAKLISWNVRKCRYRVWSSCPFMTANKEYTTQTVFYLLIGFRHLFIILIRIFNHYNLFELVVCAWCFMQHDYCTHISTIFVNCIQGKPYYVYLSTVASGLDAHSSSYIVGDISPPSWYGRARKMPSTGHRPKSKVHLLVRVFQHQFLVFLIIYVYDCTVYWQPMDSCLAHVVTI